MSISEEEVYKDYMRFVRHEAMRANTTQLQILRVIKNNEQDSKASGT